MDILLFIVAGVVGSIIGWLVTLGGTSVEDWHESFRQRYGG